MTRLAKWSLLDHRLFYCVHRFSQVRLIYWWARICSASGDGFIYGVAALGLWRLQLGNPQKHWRSVMQLSAVSILLPNLYFGVIAQPQPCPITRLLFNRPINLVFHPAIVQRHFICHCMAHRRIRLQRHCLFVGGEYSLFSSYVRCAFYFRCCRRSDNRHPNWCRLF